MNAKTHHFLLLLSLKLPDSWNGSIRADFGAFESAHY
jgi:hypothetical protein